MHDAISVIVISPGGARYFQPLQGFENSINKTDSQQMKSMFESEMVLIPKFIA